MPLVVREEFWPEVSVKSKVTQSSSSLGSLKPYVVVGSIVLAIHILLLYGFSEIGLAQYAVRGDGREYMAAAMALTQGKIVGTHFPLYSAMISAVSSVISIDLAALSIPAVFHTLFALVAYRVLVIMKFKHPLSNALMVALLPPSAIVYTSSALADSITIFFAALAFYYALEKRERFMLASAFLAGFTHYMGILLVIPLAYTYWNSNRKRLPLALVPVVPVVLLTLYQFVVTGNLLYYVSVHFTFYQRVFGTTPISYPFETLIYIVISLSGIERIYWFSYVAVAFLIYAIGAICAVRSGRKWSAVFSAPFYAFTAIYTGYYFVPRFLLYAFPSLMELGELDRRKPVFRWLLMTAVIASVVYSFWFLLIRVPSTGFAS